MKTLSIGDKQPISKVTKHEQQALQQFDKYLGDKKEIHTKTHHCY